MSKLKIEIINNIESVLPLYELNENNSKLKDIIINRINSINEININDVKNSTELINKLIEDADEFNDYLDDEINAEIQDLDIIEGLEGKEQLKLHIKKERNPRFMKKCKELFALKDKYLHCEICNFSFYEKYGDIGLNFIEGHHKYPISELKSETKVKSTDILMVCSNCHRMMHRVYPCLTQEKLAEMIVENLK
ncbi:HNH endonuclease [Clostridium beijerinckii]|uniref:HNH endonuclease n=1 Tax=Clostridium beijerinckii TaxID=1520 RepID=UPI0022E12DD8|nr:HNH endonuclease [Clostridium beijerinckii]